MKEGQKTKTRLGGAKKQRKNINSKIIQRGRNFRRLAFGSGCGLMLLSALTVCPIAKHTEYTEAAAGTAKDSTISFMAMTPNTRSETPINDGKGSYGIFAKVDSLRFALATNNYTGYTVTIKSNMTGRESTQLSNGSDALRSITEPVSEATFADSMNRAYENRWGFRPNKLNSLDNEDFLPAPSQTTILETTVAPNRVENVYDIQIGARMNYADTSGTYANDTFIIEYVANPVNYSITYNPNTEDEVAEMPVPLTQGGAASATSILLDESVPMRTGYTFGGWCSVKPVMVEGVMTCGEALYEAGGVFGIDQTTYNITILYAMWSANIYDVTVMTVPGVNSIKLGDTVCDNAEGCVVSGLAYGVTYPLELDLDDEYALVEWTNSEGLGTMSEAGYTVGAGSTVLTPVVTQNSYDVTVAGENIENVTFENEKYGMQAVAAGEVASLKHGVKYVVKVQFADGYVLDTMTSESAGEVREINVTPVVYRVTDAATLTVVAREKAVCNAEATVISEAVCLQDVNTENLEMIEASMVEDEKYTLYDARDSKTYEVMLDEEGHIVMDGELDLDITEEMKLTSLDTDLNTVEGQAYAEGYSVSEEGVIEWMPAVATVNTLKELTDEWAENEGKLLSVNLLGEVANVNLYSVAGVFASNEVSYLLAGAEDEEIETVEGAGNDAEQSTEGEDVVVDFGGLENSICPKGWTVPAMSVKLGELAKPVKVKCEVRRVVEE